MFRLCCICLCPLWTLAQFQTLDPVRFVSFYARHTLQTEQQYTDTAGTFSRGSFSAGAVLPLVHKIWEPSSTALDIQLLPALNYTRLFSSGSERILHYPQLTTSTFFSFWGSHRLALNIRAQTNEDEFTATYPKLAFNGNAYYSKGIGPRLRLHAGAGYSFIFGDRRWYPMGGLDLTIGSTSRVIVLYPLLAAYQITPSERLRLTAFAKPTGLLSYVENRLQIPDTSRQTLLFSLQSLSAGVELSWLLFPSLTLVVSPAYSPSQTTQLQHKDASSSYTSHTLSEAFVLYSSLVWRPWQHSQRNKVRQPYHFMNDNDVSIPF